MTLSCDALERLAHIGSWCYQPEDNTLQLSKQARLLLGDLIPEILPIHDWFKKIIHPEDVATVLQHFDRQRTQLETFQLLFRTCESPVRYLRIESQIFSLDDDAPTCWGTLRDVTELEQKIHLLSQDELRWRKLIQNTSDIIIQLDLSGRIVLINYTLPECEPDEVLNMPLVDFLPHNGEADVVRIDMCLNQVKLTGEPSAFEVSYFDENEHIHCYEGHVTALNRDGNVDSLIVSIRDISDRKRVEEQTIRLSTALENIADTVLITDKHGKIQYANKSYQEKTHTHVDDLIGCDLTELDSMAENRGFKHKFRMNLNQAEVITSQFVNRSPTNEISFEQKTVTPLFNTAGHVENFVITGQDVTDLMKARERLYHTANHDVLTELPNRGLFTKRLKQAINQANWHKKLVAVLFVDLDRFKLINDNFGHDCGDDLLKIVASRLVRSVREGDTVSRFGGDEFAIILQNLPSMGTAAGIAKKLLATFEEPVELAQRSMHITASIGVSLYPNDGAAPPELIKAADMAMYETKTKGRNSIHFYSNDMAAASYKKMQLEGQLRRAIFEKQFSLYFQPQFNIQENKLVGFEALLRWQHPELGIVYPSDFIGLLEETNLIIELGKWIVDAACMALKQCHEAGFSDLSMSVNLSSTQLLHSQVLLEAEEVLAQYQLSPTFLELEITESTLIAEPELAAEVMRQIRDKGFRLALDDFGTGYSSFSYLKQFPITTIKIDRSFVHDMLENQYSAELVKAVINLARALKLDVVAEGIETEEQAKFMLAHNCQLAQGYLYAAALEPEQVLPYLAKLPSFIA